MLVKGFRGSDVFGYLDFKIDFHKDVSFLVGMNGSGKTTALKLMNALVTPNFKELVKIPFSRISLILNDAGKDIEIWCETEGNEKTLGISGTLESIRFSAFNSVESTFYSHHEEKIDEVVEELNRKFMHHPVIETISKIKSPIFLGLDRRSNEIRNNGSDYYYERQLWYSKKKALSNPQRLITGSLGTSLMETELLVQNTYRRIRDLEQKQSGRLRDSILLSAFQYHDMETTNLDGKVDGINNWREKQGLIKRQNEIKEALTNIGLKNSSLSIEVDKFFNKITDLFEQLQSMDKGLSVEWLLNKAQIERMSKLVEIIDEHNTKIENLFNPINNFINTINSFYEDSRKRLIVNTVGQLIVIRPDGQECTIEGLSSGERQLLIIFAHAFFNRNSGNAVFIVDEPELSLHLGWQDKFTETIFGIKQGSQFILATHSPEIVGVHKNKSVKCR
ncbi:AAA family ATPase [Vibrio parahaemolyticus]|nr:AAA family ATPase [Vibrio parahaemolyticus]